MKKIMLLSSNESNVFFEAAVINKNLSEVVHKLLEKYKNPNLLDEMKRTPLMWAAITGDIELTEKLIDLGAEINLSDEEGFTALHLAAKENNKVIVELLIKNKADIDAKDKFGNTPLWRATYNSRGKGELITLLIKSGANPNEENNSGVSPYTLAETIGNYNVKQYFR
ncbi:MAG TPA: ankyrin repeat domain-containing protein [Patescibacteria group bacterium]